MIRFHPIQSARWGTDRTGLDWMPEGIRQSYDKNGTGNHLTDMAKANDPDPPLGLHRSEFFGFDNWK